MKNSLPELLSLADEYLLELPALPAALPAPIGVDIAGWIDHTVLKQDASAAQVEKLCFEARQYRFATVCVNSVNVPLAAKRLAGSDVLVCSVVGFPLGAVPTKIKVAETRQAIKDGAAEIDMVINIGAMKSADYSQVMSDIQAVVVAAAGRAKVKVILEMCYLDQREKIIGILMCKQAGADFVKTSTGFGVAGATAEDVILMRRVAGAAMGIKAAGGIRTLKDALVMIEAGANRIGASASVSILREAGAL